MARRRGPKPTRKYSSEVLLLVDLLGVKARWRGGGREAADKAFRRFADLARYAIDCIPPNRRLRLKGGVQSDSLALIAPRQDALAVATKMYEAAFWAARRPNDERLWLRGVIVPARQVEPLWYSSALSAGLPDLSLVTIADQLMSAIALEQAGFQGMRLLVDASAMSQRFRSAQRLLYAEGVDFPLFRRLIFSTYPPSERALLDYLWMVPMDANHWVATVTHARDLARWAGRDPEEFQHAAATLIVVESCAALLDDKLLKTGQRPFFPHNDPELPIVLGQSHAHE